METASRRRSSFFEKLSVIEAYSKAPLYFDRRVRLLAWGPKCLKWRNPISPITTIPPHSFPLPSELMQRVPNQAGGSAEFSHKLIHGNRNRPRVTQVPPVLNSQVERAKPKCTIRFLHCTLLSCIDLYLLDVSPHRYLSPFALVVVMPLISALIFPTRRTGKRFLIITLRAGHFRRHIDASGNALGHLKPSQCLASRCINVSVCMPGEIIAKKMWRRGNAVTARDLFDLVFNCINISI